MSFFTREGVEVPAVTADQMRELDRIAIQETGPNLFQMMENAGRNLALHAIETLGERWKTADIVVLAGLGGNGGGGICAARHLANRGAKVCLVMSDPSGLREVPSYQLEVYRAAAVGVGPGAEVTPDSLPGRSVDLILDAIFGYSLRGSPVGQAGKMIEWANGTGTPIVSLDVPSGVDATSGKAPGEHVRASATLTLALPKTGLRPGKTGDLYLADIGLPARAFQSLGLQYSPPFGPGFRVPLEWR